MHLNNYKIKFKQIINAIFLTIGIIGSIICSFALFAFILHGESITVSLIFLLISIIFLFIIIISLKSQKMIDNIYFYARYFEGDLDGYINILDMVNILGKDEQKIINELSKFIKRKYLKNVSLEKNGKDIQVILQSKISKCECRRCGAIIDKRVSFTGKCPYCGSSDIFAKNL